MKLGQQKSPKGKLKGHSCLLCSFPSHHFIFISHLQYDSNKYILPGQWDRRRGCLFCFSSLLLPPPQRRETVDPNFSPNLIPRTLDFMHFTNCATICSGCGMTPKWDRRDTIISLGCFHVRSRYWLAPDTG